jgi:hypothetical protein
LDQAGEAELFQCGFARTQAAASGWQAKGIPPTIFPPTSPNYFSKFRFPETEILKIKVLYGVFCDF